ncbi:MAG: glycosyltransferase family 39 protein [Planctomycetaceae bacterium]
MNRGSGITADKLVVAALLALHVALVAVGNFRHSPNLMEAADLPAGLFHLESGSFQLREVNPPLVRLIAAIPAKFAGATQEWRSVSSFPEKRCEFAVAQDFIEANGEQVFTLFAMSRLACIPFTVLGAGICGIWARRLYGPWPGVLAVGLWCFDPTILGHAATMNPDVPAAAMGITSIYFFARWNDEPSWRRGILAALFLGLALLTRTTLWMLLPVQLVAGLWSIRKRSGGISAFQLAAMFGGAIYLFNLGYGFEGTACPLFRFSFVSKAFGGPEAGLDAPSNRFKESALSMIPLPLPAPFVQGVDLQRFDFENSDGRFRSYLRGRWSERGWWYYYLYGLAVKWPLGTWALALLAVFEKLRSIFRREHSPPGELHCLICGLAILAAVSSQSGFSMHFRYVLPMFPFAFLLMSRVASSKSHAIRIVVATSFVFSTGASLASYPHTLSYFNRIAGGPANGHAHLLHSSIDWGQDLLEFRDWIRQHGIADEITLASTGPTPHELLGVVKGSPPHLHWQDDGSINPSSGPVAGWHAVSVNLLREKRYAYFLEFRPTATIGYSIWVYRLEPDTVRAYRKRNGLSAD